MLWLPWMASLLVLVFAAGSFFFALAETALFSLNPWQSRRLADQAGASGTIVAKLLKEPRGLLATLVLGNTIANSSIIAVGVWTSLQGDLPIALVLIILFGLILLGCEVVPKTLAVRSPERWALWVAHPLQWLHQLARPVQWMAQHLNSMVLNAKIVKSNLHKKTWTDEEYQELIEMAYQQGTLAQSEKNIILQIIRLDQRTVREVMRPRSQMACISDELSIEDMLATARRFKHRRLPLFDETPDTIVGILNTRTLLLQPQVDLAEAIEFPSFVPDSLNLLQLFQSLQRQQRGLAVVLDEFGQTAGLITVEDILEEMIGEIRSESEESGFVMTKLDSGRWRINGTMRVEDFRREYPALGDIPEVDTMGGLVVSLLEVVPAQGESVTYRGLKLTAQVADERRVREVLVEIIKKKGVT
jgi:putative hemolysin